MNAELATAAHEAMLDSRAVAAAQAHDLLAAGWSFEMPEIVNRRLPKEKLCETEPWQWYWRAPAKKRGQKGRRYLSTQQAFNAMRRK